MSRPISKLHTLIVALVTIPIVYAIVWAANGPVPSVGLYWLQNSNPTTSPGVVAPLNQLLIRTDVPSLYYKSGNASTAWTEIGSPGGGGGGGTVTSISCGAGVVCTPSPITSTGSIAIATQFNVPGETINTETGTELDNYDPWHAGPHTSRVEIDPTQDALTITGIVAGSDGDLLYLWNGGNGGGDPDWITLESQSASSSAANRFWIADGKQLNIPNNDGVLLIYDGGGFGWTCFSCATSTIRAQELSVEPSTAPTALTSGSTTNNYNPWGIAGVATTSYVRQDVSGSGTATITGIAAAGAPNADGRVLIWNNTSTTGSIAFTNEDAGSTGPNQIVCPAGNTVTLPPGGSAILVYDSTFDAWRIVGATNAASGAGTTDTLTMWTTPTTLGNAPITYNGSTALASTASFTTSTSLGVGGSGGPTWSSGASAPTGACVNGSMYSVTTSTSPGFYVCASSVWVAVAGGAITGSLTSGRIPVASGATTLINSSVSDNGTTVSTTEPLVTSTTLGIGGGSGPTWSSGASSPTGVCVDGSIYSVTTSTSPVFYACVSTSWVALASGGSISGTPNTLAMFTSSSAVGNSPIVYDGTSTVSTTANVTITGATTLGQLEHTIIAPTAITGTVNDYAPTGLSTATTIVTTSSSGVPTITGLTGGVNGRIINLINGDAANDLIIASNNASSAAGNRITGPWGTVNMTLPAGSNSGLTLEYIGASSRWRVIAFISTTLPSLVVTGTILGDGGNRVFDTVGSGLARDGTNANQVDLNLSGASCTAGSFVTAISSVGLGTCTAASGLISGLVTGDLTVAASATSITNYAGATCGGGTFATAIAANGGLTCSSPTGTISGLTSGIYPIATSATAIGTSTSHITESAGTTTVGNTSNFCSDTVNQGCTVASLTVNNAATFQAGASFNSQKGTALLAGVNPTDAVNVQQLDAITLNWPSTTTSLSATPTNNFGPSGQNTDLMFDVNVNTATNTTITGIHAPTSNLLGAVIAFRNDVVGSTIVFTNQDAGSISGNRVFTINNATQTLTYQQSIYFWYTGSSSGSWQELWQSIPPSSGTANDLAIFNTNGNAVGNFGGKACSGGQFATGIGADGTLTCSAISGTISGLTAGTVPVAASSTTLGNSSMTDDGTSVTFQGTKPTVCTSTTTGSAGIVNLIVPAGCTMLIWTPASNVSLVGISPPSTGSRTFTVYESNVSGGNVSLFMQNTNATAPSWELQGDLAGTGGGWTTVNTAITFNYDTTTSRWFSNWTGDIGSLNVIGTLTATANLLVGGDFECVAGADCFWIAADSVATGTQNININAAGTGVVRFNSGTGAVTNAGTGGYLFESGGASPTTLVSITSAGTVIGTVGTNGQYTLLDQQLLTSGTTYTPTTGTRFVDVTMCGAGGGGGGAAASGVGGNIGIGGGGASGAVLHFTTSNTTITGGSMSFGSPGASGANTGGTGGTGGDTTFTVDGSTFTAKGGGGGAGTSNISTIQPVAGGKVSLISSTPTGSTVGGQHGNPGLVLTTAAGVTGGGGSTALGIGGSSIIAAAAGNPGTGVCSGGGGAFASSGATAALGGAGTGGAVLIYEYR